MTLSYANSYELLNSSYTGEIADLQRVFENKRAVWPYQVGPPLTNWHSLQIAASNIQNPVDDVPKLGVLADFGEHDAFV